MEIRQFPANAADLKVDLRHPNRVLIHGLFKETFSVKDNERSFLTYIPEDLEYCSPCLVAAIPSAADPQVWITESGLKEFADEHRLFLHIAYCENGSWDESGMDAAYLNGIYVKIQACDWYVTMQDNIYLSAYGDAAFTAHQAAKTMASEWSGLMTFGDLANDLTKDTQAARGSEDQGQLELKIQGSAAQLPVWMLVSSLEGNNGTAAEYWKEQNHVKPEPYSGHGCDHIWKPEEVRRFNEINEERISEVRVKISDSGFSQEHLNNAWGYISLARRHRGQGGKCLRYYKDPAACGAVRKTMEVSGMTRTWYEYVPSACTADKKWPLVVIMHGRGGSAETFFDLSGMSVVAEERQFIAVFPEAGIHQQKKNGLRNVLLWCGEYHGEPVDDVKFIRDMVADIESRLPVDHSRIYACGQSSGGMMSDLLGYTAGDLFAAVAPWSAMRSPSRMYADFPESETITPTMWIYGDSDFLCAGKGEEKVLPFAIEPEMREIAMEKLNRFGIDPADQLRHETNPIEWCTYADASGVPLFVIGRVRDMVHANYPELSWISYDQFLSRFTKNENGEVFYCGKKVNR